MCGFLYVHFLFFWNCLSPYLDVAFSIISSGIQILLLKEDFIKYINLKKSLLKFSLLLFLFKIYNLTQQTKNREETLNLKKGHL